MSRNLTDEYDFWPRLGRIVALTAGVCLAITGPIAFVTAALAVVAKLLFE